MLLFFAKYAQKKIKYPLPRGDISIKLSNLYADKFKSIYLYKGNEIKSSTELNLISGGNYESYNSL